MLTLIFCKRETIIRKNKQNCCLKYPEDTPSTLEEAKKSNYLMNK